MKNIAPALLLCLVAGAAAAQSTILSRWNFNVPGAANEVPFGGTVVPNVGTGTIRSIGTFATAPNGDPILPMFRDGTSSTDPVGFPDNAALDQSPFPVQGQGNLTSGLEFSVSTAGFSNIVVTWDQRHSNRSARHLQFQYSIDGVTFTSAGLTDQPSIGGNGLFVATAGDAWFQDRTIDLSGIAGVANNPDFKVRLVASFAPGTSTYIASGTAGTWDTGGRYRYDLITVKSVSTSSNISASASAQPKAAITGGSGNPLLVAVVTPGAVPVSTGITATVDLTQIGGPAAQPLNDSGQFGDAGAGDGRYSFRYTVPASVAPGVYTLPVTVRDLQNRVDTPNIRLAVVTPVNNNSPVVISQLFSSGGAFGSRYNADFAELFNRSGQPQDISGWSLQGASEDNPFTADRVINFPGGTVIPAGGYYLIQLNPVAGQYGLPLIADLVATPGYGIGQPDGKVALARTGDLITTCPDAGSDPNLADLVGYGSRTDCFLGAATSLDTTVLTATARKEAGCQNTRQNFHDFSLVTPVARGSYTALNVCPSICFADFNGDTVVDFFDYLDFVDAFSAADPAADFNGDTVIDFFDYLDFVDAFAAGC